MNKITFETVIGPGGTGHYISGYRCGGGKPYGGGRVTHTAQLDPVHVVAALEQTPEGRAALRAKVARTKGGDADGRP